MVIRSEHENVPDSESRHALFAMASRSRAAALDLLTRLLWPAPWAKGRLRAVGLLVALIGGGVLGVCPFWKLRDGERRTIATHLPALALQRDGVVFSIDAQAAGLDEAFAIGGGDEWKIGAFDSAARGGVGRHRLRVNGALLPQPHTPPDEVARLGAGRHVFWENEVGERRVYFSLPSGVDSDLHQMSLIVEWRLEKKREVANWVPIAFGFLIAGCAVFAAWPLIGSLPTAVAFGLLAVPWGAVAGIFLPQISSASGEAIQRVAFKFLLLGFQCAIGLAVILWVWSWLAGRDWQRRLPQRDKRAGEWMVGGGVVAFFAVWLGATWVAPTVVADWTGDGPSSSFLGGRLPFSDAAAWYGGATAVGSGADVEWAARRPLHALLRAGTLGMVGGSYQLSLLVQMLLVGVAAGALLAALARLASLSVSLVTLVALVKFGAGFTGSYLSEASGLAAACIGFALALLGWREGRWKWRMAGYAAMTLALTLRPGPMFVLLTFPAAEWFLNTTDRGRKTVLSIVAVAAVLVGSWLAFTLIAKDGAAANANSANTLLGVARGTAWAEATQQFMAEDPRRAELPTSELTRQMYAAAWQNFRDRPHIALGFMWRNFHGGADAVTLDAARRIFDWNHAHWALILAVAMLIYHLRNGARWVGFLLWMMAGLLTSLPLIWNDGGWRGTIAVLPVSFVLCALAVSGRMQPNREASGDLVRVLGGVGAVTASLMVLGAVWHALRTPESDAVLVVDGGRDAVANIVVEPPALRVFGPLDARHADLVSALHQTGLSAYPLTKTLQELRPPFAVAVKAPERGKPERVLWLIFPGLRFEHGTRVNVLSYRLSSDGYIAHVEGWTVSP